MSADNEKKPWEKPELRTEEVEETLARPACGFKPPGRGGGPARGTKPGRSGQTPAFS